MAETSHLRALYEKRVPTPASRLRPGDLVLRQEYRPGRRRDHHLYRVDKVGKRHVLAREYGADRQLLAGAVQLPLTEKTPRRVHKKGTSRAGSNYYTVHDEREAVYDVVSEEILGLFGSAP